MRCSAPVLLAGALLLAGCGKSEPSASDSVADSAHVEQVPAILPTAAMGEQIFRRCIACHTIEAGGSSGIGPNLHGIVGAMVAARPGFAYSAALKAKGGRWDAAALDAFLAEPMKAVPGTKMAFAGVIDAADRQALILYLIEQSK